MIINAQTGSVYKALSLSYYSDEVKSETKNMYVYTADKALVSKGYFIYDTNGNAYYYLNDKIYDINGNPITISDEDELLDSNGNLLGIGDLSKGFDAFICNGTVNNHFSPAKDDNKRAVELLELATRTDTFFEIIFSRNGYDNKNGKVLLVLDCSFRDDNGNLYGKNAESSGWDRNQVNGTILSFGHSVTLSADLVAHEFMHSVERSISNMEYEGESGAIMEGYSDIFGELFEDWDKGGDLDGDCNWFHNDNRNIKNPTLSGNPWKYNQLIFWGDTSDISNDHGYVHKNSTVISHAAYKMTQGSNKLSNTQLAKLWYHTLFLLPVNCDFINLRECMEIVARNNTSIGLSEKQQDKVSEAFENANIIPEEEKINNDFRLRVLGEDNKPFSNCTIKIEGIETDEKNKEYKVTYEYMQNNPLSLHLNNGEYTITITNNDNKDTWVRRIKVNQKYNDKSILLYTTFYEIEHVHDYATITQEATCTQDGVERMVCDCGDTIDTILPAKGHRFKNGKCTVCGAFEDEEIVYSEGLEFTSNGDGTCYLSGIGSCTDTEIIIPPVSPNNDVVKRIGLLGLNPNEPLPENYAFAMCESVTSIIIPSSVTVIGDAVFAGCTSLINVSIPNNVSTIGYGVFVSCSSITEINIPNGVTSIGDMAFASCEALTSVEISDSVTSIGDMTFYYCPSLKNVEIPNGVTRIGNSAFWFCRSIEEIVIPNSVKSIGEEAFYLCSSLESLTIPNSVESIEKKAFSECTALKEVTLGNSVTTIGEMAFYLCESLDNITISASVDYIGKAAFYGCANLADVYYDGTSNDWNSIDIEEGNDELINATMHLEGEEEHVNKYETVYSAPIGCAFDGYRYEKCECGDEQNYENIPAANHVFGEWEEVFIEGSEMSSNMYCRVCENCGEIDYTFTPPEETKTASPTYITTSQTIYVGDDLTIKWIAPSGNYSNIKYNVYVLLTGSGNNQLVGEHLTGTTFTIPGKYFSEAGKYNIELYARADGYSWSKGVVLSVTVKEEQEDTGDHIHDEAPPKEECLKQEGEMKTYYLYRCSGCNSWIVAYVEEEHVHEYIVVYNAPTCTHAGSRYEECYCGETRNYQSLGILEHSYVNGTCEACGVAQPSYGKHPMASFITKSTTISVGESLTVKWNEPTNDQGNDVYYNLYLLLSGTDDDIIVGEDLTTTSFTISKKYFSEPGTYVITLYAKADGYSWSKGVSINVTVEEEEEEEKVCATPKITTANGTEITLGDGLKLTWKAPSSPTSGVRYTVAVMEAGNDDSYRNATSSPITSTSYSIPASFFPNEGTYVVILYAKATGYVQSETSINVYVEKEEIKYCDDPVITTANGTTIKLGNGLTLQWEDLSYPTSGVKYFISIMEAGNSASYVDVTPSNIYTTSYTIPASFFSHTGTYVIMLYARANGYVQSESAINVYVK